MPSGPTPVDEVANAAFWLGLMAGFDDHYNDFTKVMEFDEVKNNFVSSAFVGIDSKLQWITGKKIPVSELISRAYRSPDSKEKRWTLYFIKPKNITTTMIFII